jgi:hypothetical protein
MYVTFSLVLVFMTGRGVTSAVVPTRMNEAQCTAEAARIVREYSAHHAFCVKTEGR